MMKLSFYSERMRSTKRTCRKLEQPRMHVSKQGLTCQVRTGGRNPLMMVLVVAVPVL